jgi:hypothetical protein
MGLQNSQLPRLALKGGLVLFLSEDNMNTSHSATLKLCQNKCWIESNCACESPELFGELVWSSMQGGSEKICAETNVFLYATKTFPELKRL